MYHGGEIEPDNDDLVHQEALEAASLACIFASNEDGCPGLNHYVFILEFAFRVTTVFS